MLDQSSSMSDSVSSGGTKWTAVTGALESFVSQSGLDGTSVGLQFFGLPPGGGAACNANPCTTNADCPGSGCGPCTYDSYYGESFCAGAATSTDSCAAADYANPAVEIAPLPGVTAAITTSIGQHSPSTLTPTSAALQGAVNHAAAWAAAHPGHLVIVILATDGEPTECDLSLTNIDHIASTAYSATPSIRTYVIGVGSSLANLNGIAAAGGSSQAYMVDTGANVPAQMLAALNGIRGSVVGCTYTLPTIDGGSVDPSKVNVQYTPGGGGAPELIGQVANKAACPASGDGWYYDNPAAPAHIVLCDATCTKVSADSAAEVDVLVGCHTWHPELRP